ncbi:MAG: hypothetical protein ACOVOR_04365 [Rhabdochlamydiaceae bacterium]
MTILTPEIQNVFVSSFIYRTYAADCCHSSNPDNPTQDSLTFSNYFLLKNLFTLVAFRYLASQSGTKFRFLATIINMDLIPLKRLIQLWMPFLINVPLLAFSKIISTRSKTVSFTSHVILMLGCLIEIYRMRAHLSIKIIEKLVFSTVLSLFLRTVRSIYFQKGYWDTPHPLHIYEDFIGAVAVFSFIQSNYLFFHPLIHPPLQAAWEMCVNQMTSLPAFFTKA